MELSCESVRYAEDTRPTSCKFVELHVLYAPGDQWNMRLNKAPAEATESFISAGFIRVYPDVTLKTLRGELGALLGAERSVNKFSFLKCVGRSLALVKSKQEGDLKVKTFAPPYAEQPELYLLPLVENDSSVCSQSFTPDTSSSSSDHQIYYPPPKMCSLPTATKGLVKFPNIPQSSQQPPPTSRPDEDDDGSYSSSAGEGGNEEEVLVLSRTAEHGFCLLKPQAAQQSDADMTQRKQLSDKEGTCRNRKQFQKGNTVAGYSGVAETLEDRDSGFSLTDGAGNLKGTHTLKFIMKKRTNRVTEPAAGSTRPVGCTTPPPSPHLATGSLTSATSPVFHTNRDELTEEIKLAKEERKQLEWTRQELLRKGKDLLAQNRHRRNQARDSWKKKYFETKKATAPLEESLKNLRQEMEIFYKKLLHQLQARETRGKTRGQGGASTKITTEAYEIDNLRRKIEDSKMKLVTEIKLRKQASTELRALKVELAQKKSQSSYAGVKGNTARNRPTVQSSSV